MAKTIYVLSSTKLFLKGKACESTVHGASTDYEKMQEQAVYIGDGLYDKGFRYLKEIYAGGETDIYYEDKVGNSCLLQITKVWLS